MNGSLMAGRCFVVSTLVSATFAASVAPELACTGSQSPVFKEAIDLESTGDLDKAYALLSQQNLCQPQQVHFARLGALLAIYNNKKQSSKGAQAGAKTEPRILSADRARDLRALMRSVDPAQDQTLLQNAYPLLDELDADAQRVDGSEFVKDLRQGFQAIRSRDFGSLPLNMAAVRLLVKALLFSGFIILTIIFIVWRFLPRKGVQISFEDISGDAATKTQADSTMKTQRDRILTQQIQQAFSVPRTEMSGSGMEDLQFDSIANRDGYGFGSLVPERPLIPWDQLVASDIPIKIGPIGFSLRPLLSLITSPLQIRRRYSLVGFFNQDGERQTLIGQQLERKSHFARRRGKGHTARRSWKVESEKGENRQELILDLAAQIIIDWPASETTNNWRSYRSFEKALKLLSDRQADHQACDSPQKARRGFEQALSYDPANWLARFYLAIALRRCGDYQEAANHLSWLEELLIEADGLLPLKGDPADTASPVVRHLARYPQCTFLVLYNKAMALADSHSPCGMAKALALLERVMDPGKDVIFAKSARRLKEDDQKHFNMFGRSAWAAVKAAKLEMEMRDPHATDDSAEAQRKIDTIIKDLGSGKSDLQPEMLTSRALALAVALTAQGKVAAVRGWRENCREKFEAAENYFEKATVILPDLIDAYISRGWLYLQHKGDVRKNWAAQAEKSLEKAIELDRQCTRAKYLLTLLNATDERGRFEEACQTLSSLTSLAEAHLLLGNIYSNPKNASFDLEEAVSAWNSGLDMIKEPTFLQLEQLVALIQRISSFPELNHNEMAAIAKKAAQILAERGKCKADRELGRSLSNQLESRSYSSHSV